MTDLKAKRPPQTRMQKILIWLPLCIAFSLLVVQTMLIAYRERLLTPGSGMMLYVPALINTDQPTLITVVGWMSMGMFLLYLYLYLRQPLKKRTEKFIAFLSSLLFLCVLLTPVMGIRIKPLHTLSTDQHVYHLVSETRLFPYGLYKVLECDSTGMTCHTYGPPDNVIQLPYGFCGSDFASLQYDPSTKALMLVLGENSYPVDSARGVYAYWRCMTGLTR